jgi:hypothetical protein
MTASPDNDNFSLQEPLVLSDLDDIQDESDEHFRANSDLPDPLGSLQDWKSLPSLLRFGPVTLSVFIIMLYLGLIASVITVNATT